MSELHVLWADADQAGTVFAHQVRPWCREQWKAGKRLAVTIREAEDDKSDRQRRYYHGVVLTEIAEQATANGERFPMPVWKEYFRDRFVGSKWVTFTDPTTGKKKRRKVRISTEDLGVRKYSLLIEQVTALAATDLGVQFSVRQEDFR